MIEQEEEYQRENDIHNFIKSVKFFVIKTTHQKIADDLKYVLLRLQTNLMRGENLAIKTFNKIISTAAKSMLLTEENTTALKAIIDDFKSIKNKYGLSKNYSDHISIDEEKKEDDWLIKFSL